MNKDKDKKPKIVGIVRISNVLNMTRQEFTMIEKHIYLTTLLHIKDMQGFNINMDNDLENIVITFPASQIKETNRERIKESLEKITSRKIYFQYNDDTRNTFGYVVPFIFAQYVGGSGGQPSKLVMHLNGSSKKLFLELANGYTATDIEAIIALKSTYSIRMYELMSQYKKLGTWTVSVEELRSLLGVDTNKYTSYGMFVVRILNYCKEELRNHCKINYKWEVTAKDRRKVTELTFTISDLAKQERKELKEEIQYTKQYVKALSGRQISETVSRAAQKYSFSEQQLEYLLSDPQVIDEFIRIDLIIEDKIAKGNPPRDRSSYMAKSLKFDKITFPKKAKDPKASKKKTT